MSATRPNQPSVAAYVPRNELSADAEERAPRFPADAAGADPGAVHRGLPAADAALHQLTDWSPLDGVGWWNAWEMWNNFANYSDLARTAASGARSGGRP
jgi:hypothetical protein